MIQPVKHWRYLTAQSGITGNKQQANPEYSVEKKKAAMYNTRLLFSLNNLHTFLNAVHDKNALRLADSFNF